MTVESIAWFFVIAIAGDCYGRHWSAGVLIERATLYVQLRWMKPYPNTNKTVYPMNNHRYWSRDKQSQDKKDVCATQMRIKLLKFLSWVRIIAMSMSDLVVFQSLVSLYGINGSFLRSRTTTLFLMLISHFCCCCEICAVDVEFSVLPKNPSILFERQLIWVLYRLVQWWIDSFILSSSTATHKQEHVLWRRSF